MSSDLGLHREVERRANGGWHSKAPRVFCLSLGAAVACSMATRASLGGAAHEFASGAHKCAETLVRPGI